MCTDSISDNVTGKSALSVFGLCGVFNCVSEFWRADKSLKALIIWFFFMLDGAALKAYLLVTQLDVPRLRFNLGSCFVLPTDKVVWNSFSILDGIAFFNLTLISTSKLNITAKAWDWISLKKISNWLRAMSHTEKKGIKPR